jgi:hypothetical protein
MTHEQELVYFVTKAENGPLADWWRRIKAPDGYFTD